MGLFRKKKSYDAEDEENAQKKLEEEEPETKVSLVKLFRYSSSFDLTLMFIGACVALGTGTAMPLLAIVMGDMAQAFVNETILVQSPGTLHMCNNPNMTFAECYTNKMFSDAVMGKIMMSIYIGVGIYICSFIQVTCFLTASENMMHRLRKMFFKSILRQDIAWYDKNHSGSLSTKLFDNLERIKEGTGDKVALAIQFFSQFLTGFVVAFTYDWKLTLIMMSLSPFMIITGAFLGKLMADSGKKEAEQYAVAGSVAEEALTSLRTVYAFSGQEIECQRYETALEAGKKNGIIKSFIVGIGLGATFLVLFGSYCLAFWVGTDFVADGKMTASTLLTCFFSVMMGSMALGQAGPQVAVIGTAMGSASAIYEIIDREPEIDCYSPEGLKPQSIRGHVRVKDVHFSYPTRSEIPILKGISFEALPGQTIALVGSSGCGKSTLISLMLRYYNAAYGEITLDGTPLTDINIDYLRNQIGVVSQEPILFNCTIEENIKYGAKDVTDSQVRQAIRMANAEHFINQQPAGLQTIVGERGVQLSGGQKQRIAIARALVRNPKILMLDEATSALDAESEFIVQQALDKARQGRTTIIVAHRLSTIKNADKIIALKDGLVVETGTHNELMALDGLYHELVSAQVFADVDKPGEATSRRTSVSSTASKRDRIHSFADNSDQKVEKEAAVADVKDTQDEVKRLQREMELEDAAPRNLLEILKFAKPEYLLIAGAVLASVIQGGVFPAFSMFFTNILESFTDPATQRRNGHLWALSFLALGIVMGVSMFLQASLFGIAAERLTMRIRGKLFRNILRQDIAYFDMENHSSGKLCTRLSTDAPNVKSAIDYRLGSVFSSVIAVSAGVIIAFSYCWQMACVVVAIFPLGGVGQAFQMKYIRGRSAQDAKDMEKAGKTALEAIENIRTVQALTLEKRIYDTFAEHLEFPHRSSTRKAVIQGLTYGFATSIFFFLYAAALRFGIYLVIHSGILPMHVLRTLYAISFTAGSMGFASAYFPEYIKAKLAAGLIFKMLETTPNVDNMSNASKTKQKIIGDIDFTNLRFVYPQRPEINILNGVQLRAKAGETLAIVGPSGCGKSTIISLLERFYEPLSGNIIVDGQDIKDYGLQDLRSQIALVSQEPILFDRTIRENIFYGISEDLKTDSRLDEVAKLANIHTFIKELPDQYETRVGEKGTQLSGGQKQRIAIARALMRNPQILLLDEATSALDTNSEKIVQEALDRAREGRTSIVIAHRLATIINADCIAVITNGNVIEKGTHQELMNAKGAYYQLTQKQNTKPS